MGTDDLIANKKMAHSREINQLIAQWNANRLDLFEISEPNQDGEFHGVMRFYFQEAGSKVATKCIRVASSATAQAVIETLVEKFRPDMRMLSIPQYALYEIHENGEERQLEEQERPLLVQLNWHSDDREGRFLLRRIDEKARYDFSMNKIQDVPVDNNFKRKLSKREKKQLKKIQEKTKASEASSVAEKLYTELPETSFTRSISNPEAVMRRRRQQKLEKKLAQFRSRDGGPDTGGTLKIYGESLCRDVPYKTLLLSVNDNAAYVVKEMLAKYGINDHDSSNYCLVQVCDGEGESILEDDESPLSILMNQPSSRGSVMFHVRRRPADFHPRKRKKKPDRRTDDEKGIGYRGSYDGQTEPLLIELLPDGSETGRKMPLESAVTEVGSDWGGLQFAGLRPRHCVIAHTNGIVTLTPSSRDSDIYVNGQRIYETTILHHGTIVRFGRTYYFRFAQRSRPFSEREVIESSPPKFDSSGGMLMGRGSTISPPLSPAQEENPMPRSIRPDSILPATLELPEEGEEGFLGAVIVDVSPSTLQFKLAPTYALYLAARYRATTHFRPEVTPHERAHLLSTFLLRVAHILMQVVQERNSDVNSLAFWMANASELLHFLKSDRQIGAFSLDAQDVLAEVVQLAFRHLVTCIQAEFAAFVGHFLIERDEEDENATAPIMGVLGSGTILLRRCRVNAALTIQLFSQLLHFINMAIFNKLITMDGRNYCSRAWGNRLRRRLNRIEAWAEKQGLELAADCHLVRVVQAAHLLQSPKNSADEVTALTSSCSKLNSLQLRCLLMKYQYESDEIPISPEILNNVIRVAESTVDEVIRADGRQVRIEEEPLLGLAFLLPEDGYSCDIVRGVPSGLIDFLTPLLPICRLTPNPSAAGYWTIFFNDQMRSPSAMSGRSFATSFNNTNNTTILVPNVPNTFNYNLNNIAAASTSSNLHQNSLQHQTSVNSMGQGVGPSSTVMGNASGPNPNNSKGLNEPEVQTIKLHKMTTGLGLSIVAAKGVGQDRLGIYIKSVVKGGSADMDGRLAAGDQLLSVDGQSLVGITQEKAAEFLVRTGPVVTLEVAKQAAIYQGLATMLSQPSPLMSRDFHACDWTNDWKVSSESLSVSNSQLNERAIGLSGVNVDSTGCLLRSAYSESSISRVRSLEALSRRGLSDSAIGVPRIVGPSRLLKFFLTNNYHAHSACPSPSKERGGFNGHRRLSERDLPSKVLQEHNQDMTDGSLHVMHGLMQPRIHSSKSVPSLNSDISGNIADNRLVQNTLVPPMARTSMHDQNEPSTSTRYPPNYPSNMSMTIHPQTKQPILRHTDNMEIQHAGGYRSRSIQSLTDPPHRTEIGSKQPSTPALHLHSEEDRFYQNVAYYPPPPPPSNPVNTPIRTYIPYSSSAGNVSSAGALRPPSVPNTMFHRGPPPNLNSSFHHDASQHWSQDNRLHSHLQQYQQQPHHNQNLLRQEAKMLEMQDELRRREERAALMMKKAEQNYPGSRSASQNRIIYPGGSQPNVQQQLRTHNPPQTAPKPYRSSGVDQEITPGRPPLPDEYRFSASMGEIPRGAFTYQTNKSDQINPNSGSNPWSKEEKEREILRRKEAAKFWRDQQILELEGLGANRNPAQEEQLRAFRLEKEFQRRADELNKRDADDDGGDGDDDEDDRKAMVKRIQEDLERTRIHHGTSGPIATTGMNGNTKDMTEARARKIEEIRRKKLELEATQAAEERLVREAQKRREEEIKRQNMLAQSQQQQQFTSYQSPYRSSYPPKMDSSPSHPPSSEIILTPHNLVPLLPNSSPPALSFRGQVSSPPPQKSPVTPPQSSPRLKTDKKSVSFNETVDTNDPTGSHMGMERVREDPNVFLTEATALLSSPRSPDGAGSGQFGNTPGVIGAQEVYKDPRWRRMAEQQQQKQTANTPKPEKLTFKEKMKMFAMETGEESTPKDKVKTSKAQREIETPVAITNNINNNNPEEQAKQN